MYNHLHTSPFDCSSEKLLSCCKRFNCYQIIPFVGVMTHILRFYHYYFVFLLNFCFLDPVQVLATETELSESEMETEVTVIEKPEKSYQGIHGVEENQSAKNSGKYVCYIETGMIQLFVVSY